MRIAALETVPYALPFREPYLTARGRLEQRELLLVRLTAHGGAAGLGEAAPLALRGGPGLSQIERELHELCAPVLEGAKVTRSTFAGLIAVCRGLGVSAQALSAIDLALHDLAGKVEGEPVWRLLGAGEARPVRCNATLPAGEPSQVAERAQEWAQQGFGTFKLKVGMDGDAAQVGAVREAIGPAARIRVDANGAWSLEEAGGRLAALERFGLELAEQPAPDLSGMAALRRRTHVPLAADESVVGAGDAIRAVQLRACDCATVKLAKCGGIAGALEVAAEIPVYLSSALDGPLGIAAACHLAQVLPPRTGWVADLAHGLATLKLFDASISARGPELSGDQLRLTDEPGLGVELDELALRRHAL